MSQNSDHNSLLLSIVLPTKNRYSTLFVVLSSITDSLTGDYEVIIQDNSEDNESCLEYLKNRNDCHLKYFYTKNSIPISDNTELAIDNASGKYLVFIGDDDFISPNILKIIGLMDERLIKCLIYSPGYYWWDSIVFKKEDHYNKPRNLWLPKENPSLEFIKINPQFELTKTMSKGAMAYDMLPRLYHGIVLKSEIENLRSKIGRYIVGSCPDMDFAVSLAINIEEYYFIDYPVTIFGASKNSGGGWTALKKHYGSIESMPFLRPSIMKNWNSSIPRIWSEKTIYPQTASEVLKEYRVEEKVNLLPLYAAMIVYEPLLEPNIIKYIIKYCGYNPFKYLNFIFEILRKIAGAFVSSAKRKFKLLPFIVVHDVESSNVVSVLKDYKLNSDV